ncbi:hypothetical protein [Shinella pollutisoli]|uniref:O-antigen ligase n=1 Tax=Shinella pollutisoli TaxID=2250594 RepID=A0ABV7DGF8_9HYPH|nr:hypothetical protein [Shinella pollutisoli]
MTYRPIIPRSKRRTRASAAGIWPYLVLAFVVALRLASASTATLAYFGLGAFALLGQGHAIRALALSCLLTMINPGIAQDGGGTSIGRYAVLLAAAVSVFFHGTVLPGDMRLRPFILYTLLIGLFIIGHSILVSPIADVSILKAISWSLTMAALISAWCSMPKRERDNVSRDLFWGLVILLAASFPLAAMPTGYLTNGSGFQGVLNQPQVFGSAMAILCAWSTARLFGEAHPPWWLLGVAGASLAAILMSEARTAGVAAILGVGGSLLAGPGLAGRSIIRMAPGLISKRVWIAFFILLAGGLMMAPMVADRAQTFITKSGRAEVNGLLAAYELSRGGLMDRMLDNIEKHPLEGIGFGIASSPRSMAIERDALFGLPTGAAAEKGVTPLVVLEELGFIGAMLIAPWIWLLLRGSARGDFTSFAVCLTALLLNLGEATLFSPGGFGMLSLILLGWAYANRRSRVGDQDLADTRRRTLPAYK